MQSKLCHDGFWRGASCFVRPSTGISHPTRPYPTAKWDFSAPRSSTPEPPSDARGKVGEIPLSTAPDQNSTKMASEGSRKYTCATCGKQYQQSSHLRRHERTRLSFPFPVPSRGNLTACDRPRNKRRTLPMQVLRTGLRKTVRLSAGLECLLDLPADSQTAMSGDGIWPVALSTSTTTRPPSPNADKSRKRAITASSAR